MREQEANWKRSASGPWDIAELHRCVQAGGGGRELFGHGLRELQEKYAREQNAVATGTFHAAGGGLNYLVSGRKA